MSVRSQNCGLTYQIYRLWKASKSGYLSPLFAYVKSNYLFTSNFINSCARHKFRDFKMKKMFLNFWLILAVGLTTAVFNACDDDSEPGNNNPTTIAVTGISLNKTSLSLAVGGSETLIATVTPANAINKTVTWTSSNTATATVDAEGKVTAVSAGTTTITAKAGNKTATCIVTVSNNTVAVTSISLNKTTLSLTVGGNETLTATVLPNNATDKTVTWTSSNTAIATVVNGTVTARAAGTATITAKAGNMTVTCTITVSAISVDPNLITISSRPQFAAIVNGTAYHKIDDDGLTIGNGTPGYSYGERYYQSNFEDTRTGRDYIRITRGGLRYQGISVPFAIFSAYFQAGNYNYCDMWSDDNKNGVAVQWTDDNGTVWSTDFGSGNQTGSTFTITDVIATERDFYGNYRNVKVRILFSCILYNQSGGSMRLERGVFVGEFKNHF